CEVAEDVAGLSLLTCFHDASANLSRIRLLSSVANNKYNLESWNCRSQFNIFVLRVKTAPR
ncbi:hypothetical protein PISMIDRAFT_672510, partial [Pisolithus microcarpus 441]